MAERLREGASHYAEARCGLAVCGQPLHLVWSYSTAIYLDDTAEKLQGPPEGAALTATWQVECEAGHVLLLPPDTAEDWYEFAGRCICNPDYPDPDYEQNCPHNDMDRLRSVLAPEGDS